MSSMTRRMQIRGLKRLGFSRTDFRIVKNAAGEESRVAVSRGGLITDADGQRVGYRWPQVAVA